MEGKVQSLIARLNETKKKGRNLEEASKIHSQIQHPAERKEANIVVFVYLPATDPTTKLIPFTPATYSTGAMTIPFDPPRLLTAKLHIGFVDVPPDLIDKPIDFQPALKEPLERKSSDSGAVPSPTSLKRSQTMTGSIIVIEDNEGDKPNQAYWLARKVEQNVHGVTRV